MRRISHIPVFIPLMLFFMYGTAYTMDSGLFRTIPVDTPRQGTLLVSNTSFYSPITINRILKRNYGVTDSHIFSSFTNGALGITDHVALTGTLPFYADLFSQDNRSGEKTGPGDVSVGLRVSIKPGKTVLRGFGIGASVSIPEKFGYGEEPLGFRMFSTGELAYSAEMSFGLKIKSVEGYLSAAFLTFPKASQSEMVYPGDVFYDCGYGYLGIGKSDAEGRAAVIFQDHMSVSFGTAVPFTSWISGIVEVNTASFVEKPRRDSITRIVPGIRVGRSEGIHCSAGVDFRINGPIPTRTYMIRVSIPSLRPRGLKIPVTKPMPKDMIRSRNSLVAVAEFSGSDITYLYERELKDVFRNKLESLGIMDVIEDGKVKEAFQRMELVPRKDSPERLGIRLGANYIINADISHYTVERTSSLTIPLLIGFPETIFSLSARASVTDLVTGETHDLGVISTQVNKSRGVNLFPVGASSDIVYLSEPERRLVEEELVNRWVEHFNEIILQNLDLFEWKPRRSEISGDEEVSG